MSVLEGIFARKRDEVAAARLAVPLAELKAHAADGEPPRGFALAVKTAGAPVALIAEVKRASPSQGTIREAFDPVAIAEAYERAGAHCMSVLTDGPGFGGSAENLRRARAATALPVLRKDFLYDPYQVWEARAWGADAILLIAASLTTGGMRDLKGLAESLGMDVLVEVHDEADVERVLPIEASLIGVNNRSLVDFTTDLAATEHLLPPAPNGRHRRERVGPGDQGRRRPGKRGRRAGGPHRDDLLRRAGRRGKGPGGHGVVGVFDVAPVEGFAPEVGLLVATLDAGTYEWKDELGGIDEDRLVRSPFEGGPSIGALLLHVAECEAWWIEEVVGGRTLAEGFLQRVQAAETRQYEGVWPDAPRMPFEGFVSILDEVRERTKEILRGESADRAVPIPEHLRAVAPEREGFTVRWIVAHVAQHEAYHGGQAVMVKRMLTGGVW